MILDRLVLKNFKRFRDEEIRFKDGITGILGNNGTGKSSLVEAIFFALYGVRSTGINSDYIVSSFASPKEKCDVRLDFRIGGENYSVHRIFKKRTGKSPDHEASLFHNGKERAKGVSDVESEVKRTIGMGPVDFRNTIYAAQKDLLTLLEADPSRRKEWFLRALGIDYLNAGSQKILKEQADAKEKELQLLEGELKALTGRQDKDEFTALLASVAEFGRTLQALAAQHAGTAEKKKTIDEELRRLDIQKTEHTKLLERLASGGNEVRTLTSQKAQVSAKLSELARLEQEFRALEKEIMAVPEKKKRFELLRKQKAESDQLKTEEKFTGKKAAELKATEDKVSTKLLGLDRDAAKISTLIMEIAKILSLGPGVTIAAIEPAVGACEERIQHTTATFSARQKQLEAERKKLLADFETIKTAGPEGTCPLCRQKLGTHFTEIGKEFETKIQEIEEEAVKVLGGQEHAAAEQRKLASVKPALAEVRTLDARLKQRPEVEGELAEIRNQIAAQLRAQQILAVKIAELAFDESSFAAREKEIGELEKTERAYNDLRAKLAEVTHLRQQAGQSRNTDTRENGRARKTQNRDRQLPL